MPSLTARLRAAAVLVVCVAACAVQAPAAFAATDHAVNLTTSDSFSPNAVTVAPGDTVTWHWAGDTHNVTANPGQADTFSSGNKSTGTFVKTFNTTGRFTYRCTLHSGMTGAVTVVAAGPTDTTPPGAPTGVTATPSDSRVTIDWADSTATDLANYVVQRRVGTAAFATIASPSASVYADTTAVNGTAYSYRVMAVDLTGNTSTASATVTATPIAPPPTSGAVTRYVDIANYTFSPATITVKTGDTVAWNWSGSDLNHSVTSTGATSPSFDSHLGLADNAITGPPAGGFSRTFSTVGTYTYFCRIHTNMTGTINVTTPPATPDTTAPSPPAAPTVTAADASVTIDWPDSTAPDLNNYVLQRQTAGAGAWTTIASPVASVYVDTAVANGTSYSYRVSAVDTTGNVSLASVVVAATPVAPPPPAPTTGPVIRHVAIANYQFAPATVTVNSGDTVQWDWTGADVNHSVSSLGGLLDSFESHLGALVSSILGPPPGGSFSHTFTQTGDFQYLCRVHPDMTGDVRVVASGAPDVQPVTLPRTTPTPEPAAVVKPARTAKTFNVKVAEFAFTPANLSIRLGDVVKWTWNGEDVNHSVTSAAGQPESFESHPGLKIGEITKAPPGGSFSHVFTHEGTFSYLCRVHPGMIGKVTVSEAAAPARVRITKVRRTTGALRVSYRLTKSSSVKALVYKAGKRVLTKVVKGRSGANSARIVLPQSARRAALTVVMRGADGGVQAKASVKAMRT